MKKGLIGYPLSHSYSKLIHEDVAGYTYELFEVHPSEFDQFMHAKQFDAINVTIPYKQQILPYLDELDEIAKRIGAVNTVVNHQGKLKGYNTDYYGFQWLVNHHGVVIKNKCVAILGNGGATKAIQTVVEDMGAKECLIVSRQKNSATITYAEVLQRSNDVQVIINATPVGMYPHHDEMPLDCKQFPQCECVLDIVYNPIRTEFLLQAEECKIQTVGGLEMLVAQAKAAIEIFTHKKCDDDIIIEQTTKLLKQKQNIVFIGMPSAGKSTLAQELAKSLQLPLIDIDAEIEKETNKTIKEIFETEGEEAFRKLESQKIKDICMSNQTIISCGGGVVKSMANIHHLKKMGLLIWVDRDVEKLVSDPSRPLSKDKKAIQQLYEERFSLYQQAADYRINNNTTIEEALNEIISEIESRLK